MTVVKGWFCGAHQEEVPAVGNMPREVTTALGVNIAMTSKVCGAMQLCVCALCQGGV